MRTAVIAGAGGMGQAWAKNLSRHEDVHVGGWVDIRPGAAAESAEKLGLAVAYAGEELEKAIAEVQPDFVVDVTVPEAHCAVTLASLAAGVPVLGEKPMAVSMDEARHMVAASEKANTLYMVSQSRRYDAGLASFRGLLERETGTPGILNADFYLAPRFGGFRDAMPSPLLLDMAIHTFDQARYVSGTDPVSVYCEEFNPSWSWYAGDAGATALFEMSGGLRFTYRGCWCAPGLKTSWQADWRAVGPRGSAVWHGEGAPVSEAPDGVGRIEGSREAGVQEDIAGSLCDFLHALDTGQTPMGECHDNIKSLSMVFAAIASARSGGRVKCSLE